MSTPLSNALAKVAQTIPAPKPKFLYQFDVSVEREVDEVNTRVEEGKTITETTKVKRKVSIPFALKIPSRMEREDIDVERSVWWSRYVEKGVLPTALVNKIYSNNGGILDHVDQALINQYQAQFLAAQTELKRLEVNEPSNVKALEIARLDFMKYRNAILRIQTDNAVFFENTAEAKARDKVIEWVMLHMTYFRPLKPDGTHEEWTPFFIGDTVEDKLAFFDGLVEREDDMWAGARELLMFLAVFCADGGQADPTQIASYLAQLEEEKKTAQPTPTP